MALAGVAGVGLMAALPVEAIPTEVAATFQSENQVDVNYLTSGFSFTQVTGGNLYVGTGYQTAGAGSLEGSVGINNSDNIAAPTTGFSYTPGATEIGQLTVGDGHNTVILDYNLTAAANYSQLGGKVYSANYAGTFTVEPNSSLSVLNDPDLLSLEADHTGTITVTWTKTPGYVLPGTATVPGLLVSIDALPPSVPDGGTTIALLGFAFVGAEGLRRKLAK